MNQHVGHRELVSGFFAEQKEIFTSSTQGVYAFLDDDCRVCNEKFAAMLGYSSPEEWFKVDVKGLFPNTFVAPESQRTLVEAYQKALNQKVASTVKVNWKKKSGGVVETLVTLVPIVFQNHLFALHFVT